MRNRKSGYGLRVTGFRFLVTVNLSEHIFRNPKPETRNPKPETRNQTFMRFVVPKYLEYQSCQQVFCPDQLLSVRQLQTRA
jgi:hypothetical protein